MLKKPRHVAYMKCPVCDSEVTLSPIKKWSFNVYKVSRYNCPECCGYFNLYEGETNSYANPKARYRLPMSTTRKKMKTKREVDLGMSR